MSYNLAPLSRETFIGDHSIITKHMKKGCAKNKAIAGTPTVIFLYLKKLYTHNRAAKS